mmetsp:Transcript_15866/g.49853  ORF Transcript_15866/g.49853 Transcript_15866/m.49853 type:complete len:195 (-) Transcript_15866:104-688(-)|eukprot:CAMPEP_0182913230 /NCGR_PEP_ID=MMETSP0034_2-20130328/37931_1 /TAXON_ID=156128 /ORGANISM="Nephroselmis pyriformis, Strain CCMP717" /LENGTH=194 /DNA_ID=CAMNT_0025049941 /DNA_START=118 /DNA_END=702 /DNA_ORIENTATION=-
MPAAKGKKKDGSKSIKGGKGGGDNGMPYSRSDVQALFEIFATHDRDGSGVITIAELKEAWTRKSGTGYADDSFKALDKDKDGRITFEEYLQVQYQLATPKEIQTMASWCYPKIKKAPPPEKCLSEEQLEELRSIFVLYDEDGNGTLSRAELVQGLVETGYDEDEVEAMYEEYDTDGNDALSFEEFCQMLESSYI